MLKLAIYGPCLQAAFNFIGNEIAIKMSNMKQNVENIYYRGEYSCKEMKWIIRLIIREIIKDEIALYFIFKDRNDFANHMRL